MPDCGSVAEEGGTLGVGRAVWYSRRLAAKEATPIVDKAIARRALREEVGCNKGGRRTSLNRKKVQSKSAKCGGVLSEGETNSFMEFVAQWV